MAPARRTRTVRQVNESLEPVSGSFATEPVRAATTRVFLALAPPDDAKGRAGPGVGSGLRRPPPDALEPDRGLAHHPRVPRRTAGHRRPAPDACAHRTRGAASTAAAGVARGRPLRRARAVERDHGGPGGVCTASPPRCAPSSGSVVSTSRSGCSAPHLTLARSRRGDQAATVEAAAGLAGSRAGPGWPGGCIWSAAMSGGGRARSATAPSRHGISAAARSRSDRGGTAPYRDRGDVLLAEVERSAGASSRRARVSASVGSRLPVPTSSTSSSENAAGNTTGDAAPASEKPPGRAAPAIRSTISRERASPSGGGPATPGRWAVRSRWCSVHSRTYAAR